MATLKINGEAETFDAPMIVSLPRSVTTAHGWRWRSLLDFAHTLPQRRL
jgi:hypothetical protein